ncbi:endonuclease/exonuclease/phosphatase family metal-dependent hydrolase [Croceifilum oryzae]|uniref:Endonuclease/exonuclease/phosphatase family metal-dependent hydrolase n=1 Tax=Croceifilum oryzae TaxID=1553429 RepID=A0AAJ1TID1_9BACL|nr:endonuclease/exonuclease/phosphatase family protein [Croceifilum oryzae]MDQ0416676.1 endonuclease/exonuclease/phosphatase family metal-dependent hydrolase [Croceifilum oryzae]
MMRSTNKSFYLLLVMILITTTLIPVILLTESYAAGRLDGSYRILSYNVHAKEPFLEETPFDDDTEYPMNAKDRGKMIGQHILNGDYDIVVLSEVFDESTTPDSDFQEGLLDELMDKYPYRIEELGDMGMAFNPLDPVDTDFVREDSGLMLLTKFKPLENEDLEKVVKDMENLPDTGRFSCEEDIDASGFTVEGCSKAWHPFSDSDHPDNMAQKGVGWVRLENPHSSNPINVFFSHPQASYGDDPHLETRKQQFTEIKTFMDNVLMRKKFPNRIEDIVLAGDLNVIADTDEYRDMMNLFSDIGLQDTWKLGSKKDPGYSWSQKNDQHPGSGNQRLDYILANIQGSCYQHTALRRDFDSKEGLDLSDHYGVELTVAPHYAYCSPAAALTDPGEDISRMRINKQGNYQWVHFTNPGTYTFTVASETEHTTPFEITAYRDEDLSTPLKPWKGDSLIDKGVQLSKDTVSFAPSGPFYLRIRPVNEDQTHNKTWTGNINLKVRKHTGVSWDDAIALHPFKETNATMTKADDTGTHPMQKKTYFELRTEQLLSLKKQDFTFTLTQKSVNSSGEYTKPASGTPKEKFGYQLKASIDGPDLFKVNETQVGSLWSLPFVTNTAIPPESGEYRLVVTRPQPTSNIQAHFSMRYTTNLRNLDIMTLRCKDQEDTNILDAEDDDPYLKLNIDGELNRTLWYGDTDENQSHHDPQRILGGSLKTHKIPFTSVESTLYEEDGDGTPDYGDPNAGDTDELLGSLRIESSLLDPGSDALSYKTADFTRDSDAHYRMGYQVHLPGSEYTGE